MYVIKATRNNKENIPICQKKVVKGLQKRSLGKRILCVFKLTKIK